VSRNRGPDGGENGQKGLPRFPGFQGTETTPEDRAMYEEYYSDDRSLEDIAARRSRTPEWVAKRLALYNEQRALRLTQRSS
jgi:hypothetical protein